MGLFKYTALDSANQNREGVQEGADREAVAKRLMQQGLRPLTIEPHRNGRHQALPFLARFQQDKLTRADLNFFTDQLALLLNSGLSLDAALRTLRQHSHKPAFRDFTSGLEKNLKEGKSLSQALAEHRDFSPMYVNIVRAGEEGGALPTMLGKIAEYQATFQELKQFIVSSSIYPVFLMVVGLVAILVLLTVILPRFEVLFADLGHELPFHVRIMMDTAKAISSHPILTAMLLVGPPAAAGYYLKTPEGRAWYDRTALRLPVLAGFVQALETTRIFRTIEVLVKNGVHFATALKIASGVAANQEYRRLLGRATEALKEGRQISQRLKGEGLLPDLATDLLAIGEESGRVGEVCGQIADHYEKELRVRVKRLIALIEPLFILGIALVAGYVVISMLSVILSINEIAG